MTTKQEIEKAREELIAGTLPKCFINQTGIPSHMFDALTKNDREQASRYLRVGFSLGLQYALNLPEVIEMYEVAKHEGVDTEFDKLLKEIGE